MREFAKAGMRCFALIAVSPLLLWYWCWSLVLGRDRALEGCSQALSLAPGLIGQYLRRAFLSQVLAECHKTAVIEFGTLFSQTGTRLEENVYVGPRCHLGLVHIGRDALLGPAVQIPSGGQTHGTVDPTKPIREQAQKRTLVRIGAGVWIGGGAIVMADVGPGAVVGAGSVVTRPLPEKVVAVGAPARVVKKREAVMDANDVSSSACISIH